MPHITKHNEYYYIKYYSGTIIKYHENNYLLSYVLIKSDDNKYYWLSCEEKIPLTKIEKKFLASEFGIDI